MLHMLILVVSSGPPLGTATLDLIHNDAISCDIIMQAFFNVNKNSTMVREIRGQFENGVSLQQWLQNSIKCYEANDVLT